MEIFQDLTSCNVVEQHSYIMKMEPGSSSKRCQPSTRSHFPEDSNLQFICGLSEAGVRRSDCSLSVTSAGASYLDLETETLLKKSPVCSTRPPPPAWRYWFPWSAENVT